jgi:hypothetical protein
MKPLPAGLRGLTIVVRILTVLGAAVLIAVPVWFWLDENLVRDLGRDIVPGLGAAPITVDDRARWLGAGFSLLGIVLGLYVLWQLWRLFGEYAAARFFDAAARFHLRRFAWALLAAALLVPLLRGAIGVALTLGNPPGQRMLVIGLAWNDYLAILIGAVLLAIATVQAEAARLAEENAGFV